MPSSLRQESTSDASTLGTATVPWEKVFTKDAQFQGDVEIQGSLTVTGDAQEVTVDKLSVEEPMIKVAKINTGTASDIGLYGAESTSGTAKYHGIVRDADDQIWKLFEGNQEAPADTTVNFSGTGSVDGTLQAKLNLPAAGDLKIAGTVVGATAAEINVLDGATAGTAVAEKALIVDSNKDVAGIRNITATGTVQAGNILIQGSAITVDGGGSPSLDTVDINGGTIDGTTIATSNITVGAGKTLDVSAGTFSTSAAQKLAILQGAASDVDVGGFDLRAKTLTADDLTDTRVVFAGTDGVLSDNANLTFATDTLTATKIGAFEAAGAINFANQAMTNVDINSGEIDGATIATSNITVGNGKTLDVSAGTITFAAGQIANVSLANDSVSFGGVSLDLGQSDATPAFDLTDATNYPTSSLVGTITNAQLAGSIADSKLNTITTSDKVSGSAVQLAATSAIEDSTGLRLKSDVAGDGLDLSAGQVLSVNVDDSSIETNSDSLRVKALGITNAMLAGSIDNSKLSNSALTVTAGNGLTTGGSVSLGGAVTIDANVDDSSIEVASDALQVKALGVTNAMLAGSIENSKLSNNSVSYGGVELALGASDATPAFDLADATNLPTTSLTGTITNAQLAGSIANAKLANSTISGIALGANLSDLTVDNSSIKLSSGTTYNGSAGLTISVKDAGVTNAMLAGSIENSKLSNSTVSFGGVSLALGASDATPAFDLTDATNYPTASLVGTITNAQLAGSIANAKLANSTVGLAADSGSADTVALGQSITFTGGDSISTVVADNEITVNADDASSSSKGVAMFHSDDFTVTSGMVQIASNSVTNDQLAGSIVDSKLSQITTADKVALSALAISSETAEVTTLADQDLFVVDDANGNNSKVEASVIKSFGRSALSVTDSGGDGSLSYNDSTGVFTYTGPSAAEVRAHITAGTGVTVSSGEVAIGQAVGTGDNVTFAQVTIGTNAVISETDAEKIDDITDGTAAANKALVVDSNKDIASIRNLTAVQFSDGTATLTGGNLTASSVITPTVYPSSGDLTLTATGSNKVTVVKDLNCEGKIIGGDSGVEFQGSMTLDTDDHVIIATSNKTLPAPTAGREMVYINNSDSQITITVSNTALHDIYSAGSAANSVDIAARMTLRLIAANGSLGYVV